MQNVWTTKQEVGTVDTLLPYAKTVDNISFPNFRLDECLALLFTISADTSRFKSESISTG